MRTLIYGLGESGLAAASALKDLGADVLCADTSDDETLRQRIKDLDLEARLAVSPEAVDEVDRIVVSPGISPSDPLLARAEDRGVPIISEVGLGLEILGRDVRVAAITGTNGKTTAVDMLSSILTACGMEHSVAGNSWRALTGCLEEVRDSGMLALELSSFQLHYLPAQGFDSAGLLNVRPDHMNWHASYEEYTRDKLNIFGGQDGDDLAVVSASDPVGLGASGQLGGKVLVVGRHETGVVDGHLVLEGQSLVREDELPFTGSHNFENALFAAASATKLGASIRGIREGLRGYRLKPHRMELVAEVDDVMWVDDSKATNPAAVAAALSSFRRPVVLILGGSEKDTDFGEIIPQLGGCRAVVCQGEAGPRLYEFLKAHVETHLTEDLVSAVEISRRLVRRGDAVLLSPGCASFDQFGGYAERGDAFASLVRGDDG